ncbi:MAG: cupredoxin domain-containing protein [Acidimicrobiales bacterium]
MLSAFGLSACGAGTSPPSASGTSHPAAVVHLTKQLTFSPASVVIKAGQTVEWKWQNDGIPHNVTFPTFESSTQTAGTYYRTFNQVGTFPYVCTLHQSEDMIGTVVVVK